jgi:hypothetical protein
MLRMIQNICPLFDQSQDGRTPFGLIVSPRHS